MKRIACFATFATLVTSYDALAVGASANVTIIDRDSGVPYEVWKSPPDAQVLLGPAATNVYGAITAACASCE